MRVLGYVSFSGAASAFGFFSGTGRIPKSCAVTASLAASLPHTGIFGLLPDWPVPPTDGRA